MRASCIITLTALGVLLASCSGAKQASEQPQGRTVTLSGTIGMVSQDGETSRALTAQGKKTFAPGEKVAVVYTNTGGSTVKADSAPLTAADISYYGKKARISVTLTDPEPGGALTYIYPATMAQADGSVNYSELDFQDGTIEDISSRLDLCTFTGTLTAEAQLPDDANLANEFALCEFTVFKKVTVEDITEDIGFMTIDDGTYTYTINIASPVSHIYVAMRGISKEQTITFTARSHSLANNYSRTVSGKDLFPGHFYPVNLKEVTRDIDLSLLAADFQAVSGDRLFGTLAENVKISIADKAAVILENAHINESRTWTTGDYAGITCEGDATITLVGTNHVTGFAPSYPAVYFPPYKRLTLNGSGSLEAHNNAGDGAGIGGVGLAKQLHAGYLTIAGGTITAYGGEGAAGIGAGKGDGTTFSDGVANYQRYVDGITISGGTVTAYGGEGAAGIGAGYGSRCYDITISDAISSVTAVKGTGAINCIGKGSGTTDRRTIKISNSNLSAGDLDSPSFTSKVYGNLKVTISETNFAKDTWTVTPKS